VFMPCSALAIPPAAPTLLTAEVISFSHIRFRWIDNSTNELFFMIQRKVYNGWNAYESVDPNVKIIDHTTDLSPETTYTFRVVAYNNDGVSYSNEVTATTGAIPTPLGLVVTAVSATTVGLNWTDTRTDVAGYGIEITWEPFGYEYWETGSSIPSYVVGNLQPSTAYAFRVVSYDATYLKHFSPYSQPVTTTTQADANAPTLTAIALSSKRIKLSWGDTTNNGTAYYVEYVKGTDTLYTVMDPLPVNTTTYIHANLEAGISYTYRVRSFNGMYYGSYSNEVTLMTSGCVAEGAYIK